jgi:hypothetical protein
VPLSPDAISVKFASLQELRTAIQQAQTMLNANRTEWMNFTTGTMAVAWADDAGLSNQDRNMEFSKYGDANEQFLAQLTSAVDKAEMALRDAVARARAAIAG